MAESNGCTKTGIAVVLVKGVDLVLLFVCMASSGFASQDVPAEKITLNRREAVVAVGKTLKLKASRLIRFIRKGQGKKTYRIVKVTGKKYRKFFTLNHKTGKLKIKKGLPKGRYKIKVKVRVSGNAKYKAAAKSVTIIVKVK